MVELYMILMASACITLGLCVAYIVVQFIKAIADALFPSGD